MAVTETLRADARRNRERIITSASELFASEGIECLVAEVAKHAGVGNATVFRHFPTKLDLVAAVVERRLTEMLTEAERAAAMEDPGAALEHFIGTACRVHVQDQGLKQMAAQYFEGRAVLTDIRDRMFVILDGLIARGKEAGVVRPEAEGIDVLVLVGGIGDIASDLEAIRPGLWQRYADLVVAALRPTHDGRELRPSPPTAAELEAVWQAQSQKHCAG